MFALPSVGPSGGAVVKSIQRGVVAAYSGNVTISKVDVNKSVVILAGTTAAAVSTLPYANLSDATTLTFGGSTFSTAWQVLEFA